MSIPCSLFNRLRCDLCPTSKVSPSHITPSIFSCKTRSTASSDGDLSVAPQRRPFLVTTTTKTPRHRLERAPPSDRSVFQHALPAPRFAVPVNLVGVCAFGFLAARLSVASTVVLRLNRFVSHSPFIPFGWLPMKQNSSLCFASMSISAAPPQSIKKHSAFASFNSFDSQSHEVLSTGHRESKTEILFCLELQNG